MKSIEKNTAIKLRKEGKTINQIAKEIGVAKSSVYNWVKETPLPLWYNTQILKKQSTICNQTLNSPEGILHRQEKEKQRVKYLLEHLPETQICSRCNKEKDLCEFGRYKSGIPRKWCKKCHIEFAQEKHTKDAIHDRAVIKLGGICTMCGCNEIKLLEIDHIDGNGYLERRLLGGSRGVYLKIINGNIEDLKKEYECLCVICHNIKHATQKVGYNGYTIVWKNRTKF